MFFICNNKFDNIEGYPPKLAKYILSNIEDNLCKLMKLVFFNDEFNVCVYFFVKETFCLNNILKELYISQVLPSKYNKFKININKFS